MLRAGQKVRVYGNPSLPLANTHMGGGGGMGAYLYRSQIDPKGIVLIFKLLNLANMIIFKK